MMLKLNFQIFPWEAYRGSQFFFPLFDCAYTLCSVVQTIFRGDTLDLKFGSLRLNSISAIISNMFLVPMCIAFICKTSTNPDYGGFDVLGSPGFCRSNHHFVVGKFGKPSFIYLLLRALSCFVMPLLLRAVYVPDILK